VVQLVLPLGVYPLVVGQRGMHPMEGIVQEGLEVSSEVVAYLVLEEFLKQMELLFKEAPFL